MRPFWTSGQADVDAYRHRTARDKRRQCRVKAALVKDGWMDAAHQAAQILDRYLGFLMCLLEERPRVVGVALEPGPGDAQLERQRDEPWLQPVVQVPLDPPPLGISGLHRAGASHTEVLNLGGELPGTARAEQGLGECHIERRTEPDYDRPQEHDGDADRHDATAQDIAAGPHRPGKTHDQEREGARDGDPGGDDERQPGELVQDAPADDGRLDPCALPRARRAAGCLLRPGHDRH
jgi:hypothetical protein